MYSYAVNGPDSRVTNREWFLDYLHEFKTDPKKMEAQPFEEQAKSLMGDLDAFRDGFGSA